MSPTLLDHAFVVLVLGLIFPLGGWWAYRRFLARAEHDPRALVREYQVTLIWLFGVGIGAALVWVAGGRSLAGLGLNGDIWFEDGGMASGLAIGALIALIARPIVVALVPKAAATVRASFGDLEAFLPKTREQLAWGLTVSVAAGVFEEIAYRGYLIPYFETWMPTWGALAASSILFGCAHFYQGKLGTLGTTILGAGLGWIYLETGSLVLPIMLHAVIDISAMVTAWIVLRRPAGRARRLMVGEGER